MDRKKTIADLPDDQRREAAIELRGRLTREQAAIVGAYTGITIGPFCDIHRYAERKLGRPLWTHQFGSQRLADDLRAAAASDYENLEREGVL